MEQQGFASFFDSSRRHALVLSAGAVALLAGRDVLAQGHKPAEADVRILNTALAAELEAVAAYQVGAESGLLGTASKPIALQFQGHHKEHADVLAGTIRKMGGRPVEPRSRYSFPLEKLKSEADVLRFAAGLERGAVSAYVNAVPLFHDRELSKAAASILADEAMHWAVLRQVLGETPWVPSAFLS
ncbi:MAG: ferritin-like domain-containing protein [Burkholderiales bacterium]|nr:ferritin-like domain-containing protein [Burkholderiales bacterium]